LEAAVNFTRKVWIMASAAVVLSACDNSPATTTTTDPGITSSPPAPSRKADATEEALSAYREMWGDFADAGKTSDWQAPSLSRHTTGTALNTLTQSLYRDNTKGFVSKGEPVLSPVVYSFEPHDAPKKVAVTDCGDSTNWLKYRKDNGQLADDVPGGKRRINAVVEKQADGTWKVSDFGVHDVGSC
jgi:hypothetical protein